jgi:hypothetical protein
MARRCSQRMRRHACAKVKVEGVQQASDRMVSLAFWLLRRAKLARDRADWLAEFTGVPDGNRIYPAGARDRLAWASRHSEGKTQRDRGAP